MNKIIDPNSIYLRFYCPRCNVSKYADLTSFIQVYIPICIDCDGEMEYVDTSISENSFEEWLKENPGTDRFWCEEHGAYEASKSYCNSCQKELSIDRDEYIEQLVEYDWNSLSIEDTEIIFKEDQEKHYRDYSNEQLKTAMKDHGLLGDEE